jgi:hypothetical protein
MISKPKSAKLQPKSNGHHAVKASKMTHKTNGVADRLAAAQSLKKSAAHHIDPAPEMFRGVLHDFNLSPKGGIEGFLLHADGKTVQINVTPDIGFAVVRGIGQTVEATVEPDHEVGKHGKGDHPVFNLVKLTGTDGKALIDAGHGAGEMVTVQGVVKRINFARHGAANGVVLESGDFIHLKPEGMKKVALKVGDAVTAEGPGGMMPLGQQIVEAKTVNGTTVMGRKAASRRNNGTR